MMVDDVKHVLFLLSLALNAFADGMDGLCMNIINDDNSSLPIYF